VKKPDILTAIQPVVEAFEQLGVRYYIGGSVASSAYGIARATLDVDMVSNLTEQQVPELLKLLGTSYYIDEAIVRDAIKQSASFNIIHLDTMLKVDIFIVKQGQFHKKALDRRRKDTLDEDAPSVEFYLASPEDLILNKLDWYRLGGEVSERQWNDIQGVLKVQGNMLDIKYLLHWAAELELLNLLEQALQGADLNP
jgi:hypothetical protein